MYISGVPAYYCSTCTTTSFEQMSIKIKKLYLQYYC